MSSSSKHVDTHIVTDWQTQCIVLNVEQATSYSRVGEKTLKWLCQEVSSTGHLDLFSLTGSSFVHSYSYTVSPVSLKWLTISCFYNISSSRRRTFLFKYFLMACVCVGQRKEEHVHIWVQEPTESRRGCRSPLQLLWVAEWLFGRKLGPLKEQYVLLITKVSLLIHSGTSYQWCK